MSVAADRKFGEDLLDEAIDTAVTQQIDSVVEAGREAFAEIELAKRRRDRTQPPPLPVAVGRKHAKTVPPPIPADAAEVAHRRRATAAADNTVGQDQPNVPVDPAGVVDIETLRKRPAPVADDIDPPTEPPGPPAPPPIERAAAAQRQLLAPSPQQPAAPVGHYQFWLGFVTALALVGVSLGVYAVLTRHESPPASEAVHAEPALDRAAAGPAPNPEPARSPEPPPRLTHAATAKPGPAALPPAAPAPLARAKRGPGRPPTTPAKPPTTPAKPPTTPAKPPTTPAKPPATPSAGPPVVVDPPPRAPVRDANGNVCDEVQCLVDASSDPCCKRLGFVDDAPKAVAAVPDQPSRADITKAIASIRARMGACAERYDFGGNATLVFTVLPDGAVKDGKSLDGPPEFRACAAASIAKMRLPATKRGRNVRYPFVFN